MGVTSAWTDPNGLDLLTGQVLTQTAWEQLLGNLLWLFGTTGASGTFTPTLTQSGAVSTSSAIGRYIRVGKWVIGSIHLVASSAGTGANQVVVGALPVTAANTANGGLVMAGSFQRSGGPMHGLFGNWASNASANFISGAAATGLFGVNPAVTIASGDTLDMFFAYEGT